MFIKTIFIEQYAKKKKRKKTQMIYYFLSMYPIDILEVITKREKSSSLVQTEILQQKCNFWDSFLGLNFARTIIIYILLKQITLYSTVSVTHTYTNMVCAFVNVFGQSAIPGQRQAQAYPLFELCSDRPQSLNPS